MGLTNISILLNLMMDVLSKLLKKGVLDKKIDSYTVNGAKLVSNLIYVDDALIFSMAIIKSLCINIALRIFPNFFKFRNELGDYIKVVDQRASLIQEVIRFHSSMSSHFLFIN